MKAILPLLAALVLVSGCRTAAPSSAPAPATPAAQATSAAPATPPTAAAAPTPVAPPVKPAAPPAAPPKPLTADEDAAAHELVVNNCLSCHTPEMLDQQRLTAKQWDAEVKKMQGWGAPVEPENVDLLVRYATAHYGAGTSPYELKSVDARAAAAAILPLPDGPYAKGSAKQGEQLYREQCASCHGADGRGAAVGVNLVDRTGLYRAPEFAALLRAGRGRMPQFTSTDREIASMLAYLRTLKQ